jgi:parallel beta-helix repeat protein
MRIKFLILVTLFNLFAILGEVRILLAKDLLPIGGGCTNAFYIDNDCDGYGVGSPLGPDADDHDPAINTGKTVVNKYRNPTSLLNHLGHKVRNVYYISTDGRDDTGEMNNIEMPFATWKKVKKLLKPGDGAIFRGGEYKISWGIDISGLQGTSEQPIIIMAYPGEKVIIDGISFGVSAAGPAGCAFVSVDGFVLDNTKNTGLGDGIRLHLSSKGHNIVFRNIEARNWASGAHAMCDLHYIIFENCVFHNNKNSHGIYLGARATEIPNDNIIVRNCIIYQNGRHGFQHNGRITNLLLENNIIHSNNMGGVSLLNGVSQSILKNNLIFNNNRQGIIFYLYDSTFKGSRAFDQTNNLIINNTIWIGRHKWKGDGEEPGDHASIGFADDTKGQLQKMGGNIFRNNILVTYNGPSFRFREERNFQGTVIEKNLLFRDGGISKVIEINKNYYDFRAFNNLSNLIKNNQYAPPGFTDVSVNYYSKPGRFNFDYLPTSKGIDFGGKDDAPAYDLKGNLRVGNPDLGCYEYVNRKQN